MTACVNLRGVVFAPVRASAADSNEPCVAVYVSLPGEDDCAFAAVLTVDEAAGLALALQGAAGVMPAIWLGDRLS